MFDITKSIFLFLLLSIVIFVFGCHDQTTSCDKLLIQRVDNFPYNQDQILFSFSFLADINSNVSGSEEELKSHASNMMDKVLSDNTFQKHMGKWDIAWGPVIYSKDCPCNSTDCVTDNTMVLLERKRDLNDTVSLPEYVLAVAGTNAISAYGWFTEDFDVKNTVNWPDTSKQRSDFNYFLANLQPCAGCSGGSCISYGTAVGVNILFSMRDTSGLSIVEYLKQNVGNKNDTENKKSIELAVTGHSLGGALAPTVALALKDYQAAWNSSDKQKVKVSTAPYAGASPGNSKFRTYLRNSFTDGFYGCMNSLDIVPHAWQPDMMNEIASIYAGDQSIGTPCLLEHLVGCVEEKRSIGNDYATLYNPEEQFPGGYYCISDSIIQSKCKRLFNGYEAVHVLLDCGLDLSDCTSQDSGFPQTMRFLLQAGKQHINGYVDHFNVHKVDSIIVKYTNQDTIKHEKHKRDKDLEILVIDLFKDLILECAL